MKLTSTAFAEGQPIPAVYTGEGTFYGADGSGNCSYDRSPGNLMVAAMKRRSLAIGWRNARRVKQRSSISMQR